MTEITIKEILAKLKAERNEYEIIANSGDERRCIEYYNRKERIENIDEILIPELEKYLSEKKPEVIRTLEWYSQWKEKYGKEVEEYFKAYKAKEAEDKCGFAIENDLGILIYGEFMWGEYRKYYNIGCLREGKSKDCPDKMVIRLNGLQLQTIIEALTNALKVMKD